MSAEQRFKLKESHLKSINSFTNESCQNSMDNLKYIEMPMKNFRYNRLLYITSRFIDRLHMKYNKKHPRVAQFEDFRKLDEQ
jgi:hypothetical protein